MVSLLRNYSRVVKEISVTEFLRTEDQLAKKFFAYSPFVFKPGYRCHRNSQPIVGDILLTYDIDCPYPIPLPVEVIRAVFYDAPVSWKLSKGGVGYHVRVLLRLKDPIDPFTVCDWAKEKVREFPEPIRHYVDVGIIEPSRLFYFSPYKAREEGPVFEREKWPLLNRQMEVCHAA